MEAVSCLGCEPGLKEPAFEADLKKDKKTPQKKETKTVKSYKKVMIVLAIIVF